MKHDVLSDETWAALDPRAGALSGKQRRRLGVGLAAALAALLAGALLWWSGLVLPHLAINEGQGESRSVSGPGVHTFSVVHVVMNRGWHTEHVVAAGRSGRGLELVSVHGLPTDIAPGKSVWVRFSYRVTDCDAVPRGSWPIPLHVQRPWGDVTTQVQPPDSDDSATPVPWQVALAQEACS